MMRQGWPDYYRLLDQTPIACGDTMDWAHAVEARNKEIQSTGIDPWRVALTDITDKCHVSTVFLSLDHSFFGDGDPLLFETLVFGGPLADEMNRYTTWANAQRGHDEIVARVRIAIAQVQAIARQSGAVGAEQ